MTNPHCDHPGHTSRCALFSSFSGPVPVLYRCVVGVKLGGITQRLRASFSGVINRQRASQPSWRVRNGSVRLPCRAKISALTIQWQVFAVFSQNAGKQSGARDTALYRGGDGASASNDAVTFCTGFFCRSVRITFRALLTSSSLFCTGFPR